MDEAVKIFVQPINIVCRAVEREIDLIPTNTSHTLTPWKYPWGPTSFTALSYTRIRYKLLPTLSPSVSLSHTHTHTHTQNFEYLSLFVCLYTTICLFVLLTVFLCCGSLSSFFSLLSVWISLSLSFSHSLSSFHSLCFSLLSFSALLFFLFLYFFPSINRSKTPFFRLYFSPFAGFTCPKPPWEGFGKKTLQRVFDWVPFSP